MSLTKSNEDYLEAIYILQSESGLVKSIRIAEMLGVSRPAVNKAMNELHEGGFIEKSSYSKITLTETGINIAKAVYLRHVQIKKFLIGLGVSEEVAEIDCCKIEHVVSPETLAKIIQSMDDE